jgi:hypothetical protein
MRSLIQPLRGSAPRFGSPHAVARARMGKPERRRTDTFPFELQAAVGGGIRITETPGAAATIIGTTISGNHVGSTNLGGDAQANSGGLDVDGSLLLVDSRVDRNTVRTAVPPSSGNLALHHTPARRHLQRQRPHWRPDPLHAHPHRRRRQQARGLLRVLTPARRASTLRRDERRPPLLIRVQVAERRLCSRTGHPLAGSARDDPRL